MCRPRGCFQDFHFYSEQSGRSCEDSTHLRAFHGAAREDEVQEAKESACACGPTLQRGYGDPWPGFRQRQALSTSTRAGPGTGVPHRDPELSWAFICPGRKLQPSGPAALEDSKKHLFAF